MKKLLTLILLIGSIVCTSCIKDLEERGVYETTRCYGVVLDTLTQQPMANVRIVTTDHVNVDNTVYTNADGTFEIPVHVGKLSADYFICFDVDSLFQSYEIRANDLKLGAETYDLGTIYFHGAVVPKVSTEEPSNITTTSAHCSGFIDDFGYSEIIECGFVYGTMQYPTINNSLVRAEDWEGDFGADLVLSPHTTYYVRAYAINSVGVGYGNQEVLTTLDGLPNVTTSLITDITSTTAGGGGHVVSDGGFPVTSRGLCWSRTSNPTITNTHSVDGSDTGSFVRKISGLQPGTTYYVRAYAQNEAGIAYGTNMVFTTTSGLPSVTTASVSHVTASTAEAGGTVVGDGGFPVVRRGVCYSTSPMPTTSGLHTTDGTGLGTYVSQMTGLLPATTYYFRAYATNGVGTVYGDQHTFVTE